MLRGGHEPGARVVRDARLRPLLERGDQRVLRELFGQADVAHDPRQAGDEPGRLDPPDRVDRAMGVSVAVTLPIRMSPIQRRLGRQRRRPTDRRTAASGLVRPGKSFTRCRYFCRPLRAQALLLLPAARG